MAADLEKVDASFMGPLGWLSDGGGACADSSSSAQVLGKTSAGRRSKTP
jgi:hypothetical protein